MKIVNNYESTTPFSHIKIGDVFVYKNAVEMAIPSVHTTPDMTWNAINLRNGTLDYLDPNALVTVYSNATINVKGE